MPITASDTRPASIVTENIEDYTLKNIGIEYEVPLVDNADDAPLTYANTSGHYRDHANDDGRVPLDDYDTGGAPNPRMSADHTGAEVPSEILDLHSDQPSLWYRAMNQHIRDCGLHPAFRGDGYTSFGLHFHLSTLDPSIVSDLQSISSEAWWTPFFTASIHRESADPWRHYGRNFRHYNSDEDGHYEFRLPEPGLPEHVDLMVRFFQLLETNGLDDAVEFARGEVMALNDDITCIRQAKLLLEDDPEWPHPIAFKDGHRNTDRRMAESFNDLVIEPLHEVMYE